eukprot:scaffold7885_cov69-Phaeocystis_antarctica.AAC.3
MDAYYFPPSKVKFKKVVTKWPTPSSTGRTTPTRRSPARPWSATNRQGGRRLRALLLWPALCAHGAAVAEPPRVGRARGLHAEVSRGATDAGAGGAGIADQGRRPAAQSEGVGRRGALGAAGRHAGHGSGGQATGFSRRRSQSIGDRGSDGVRDSQPPLHLCLRRRPRGAARRARGARRGGRRGVGRGGALVRRRGSLRCDAGQRHSGAAWSPCDASPGGSA